MKCPIIYIGSILALSKTSKYLTPLVLETVTEARCLGHECGMWDHSRGCCGVKREMTPTKEGTIGKDGVRRKAQ